MRENSVYSFATVLIVVLVCLSLGAWLASRLARSKMPAPQVLLWLFALGGAALAMTPLISMGITRGMKMLDTDFSFAAYVFRLFATGFATIGPACLPLGAVFPFLMKGEEEFITHAGKSIGALSAINTGGAILGSLAAGFLLLESLGIWHTIQLVSAIYLIFAVLMPVRGNAAANSARVASGVMLVLLLTLLNPSRLAEPSGAASNEDVMGKWEGSDATVTVVRDSRDDVSIRINSNYSLGSRGAYGSQMFQARIPLLAWPASDSVFFLGMGTGITAGEALSRNDFPKVEKVVACELSPNVVAASRKYFTAGPDGSDLTNGLYTDPRAEVVIADGRNHPLANRDKYSMINARTMLAVFPQVSLWRGNFQPGAEVAAMVGHADHTPLPASTLDVGRAKQRAVEGATHLDMQDLMLPFNEQTITLFYGGNLTLAGDLFEKYPLNTDDRPVIEFGTPRSLHQPSGSDRPQFLETPFANLVDKLQSRTPPDKEPLLANRRSSGRKLPLAGSAFHRAWIARIHGDEESWKNEWETFLTQWTEPEPAEGAAD